MTKKLEKFGVTVYKKELKNGVNLFLFERKGMPIYLRVAFFAGSRFDSIPGTAHFLEHILVSGTKRFPTKNLIAEHLQRIGGDFGGTTNSEFLRLNIEIPEAVDMRDGLEVLNEILNESLFEQKTLDNETKAILSEFYRKKSNPKEYVNEVSRRISLQGTAPGQSILGNPESIQSINKEMLLEHKNNFMTSGRAVFIASGDIEINSLSEYLEKIKIPISENLEIKKSLPVIDNNMNDIEKYPGIKELQVILSCRTFVENYTEYCALKVLNSLLGGGRGSRLITKLRYHHGLVYTVSSQLIHSLDWGALGIKLSCDKSNFERVKEIIFREFDELVEKGISNSELVDIKVKISKGFTRHHQTSESWVDFHELQAMFNQNDLKIAEDYVETVSSLTIDNLKNVINKYLKRDNFFTAICGDY